MKMYVVSWYNDSTMPKCLDGVYSVFDTIEKAQRAVFNYITAWKDTLVDTDIGLVVQVYYTAKGIWRIERMELNDEGLDL